MAETQISRGAIEAGRSIDDGGNAFVDAGVPGSAEAAFSQLSELVQASELRKSVPSSAANDDFVALDAHLRLLKRQGDRQPERRALVATAIIALLVGGTLTPVASRLGVSWPILLIAVFLFAVMFFSIIVTALRQRAAEVTLTTLLRTTSHLAQPEALERQRLAVFDDHVRADLAALDDAATRVRADLDKAVDAMKSKLQSFDSEVLALTSKVEQTFENLSIERAAIATNSENLRLALLRVSSDASAQLASVAGNLQSLFQSKSEGLIEVIDQRNRVFIQQYLDAEDRSAATFERLLDNALMKVADRGELFNDRFLSAMARRQEDFEQRFEHHMRQTFNKSEHQVADLLAKTEQIATNASHQVNVLLERADKALEQKSQMLHATLATTIIDLSQSFRQNTSLLQETIDGSVVEVGKLAAKCRDAGRDLGGQVSDFKESVVEPLNFLTQAFGEKSRTVASDVIVEVTSFNEAIAEAASQMISLCDRERGRFKESSDAAIRQIKESTDQLLAECVSSSSRREERSSLAAGTPEIAIESQDDVEVREQQSDVSPDTVASRPSMLYLPSFTERYRSRSKPQSWISELLARTDAAASLDKDASPSDQSIDVVQAILSDIDGLVDTSKANHAWSVFKEKNIADFDEVFTPQGKVAYASLKQQLDRDSHLFSYVEDYLKKVESLVKEAYAEVDDEALLSYMISPNGKTYTLLAYVIERI